MKQVINSNDLYKFGYAEYIDDRGLTDKARRAKAITSQVATVLGEIGWEIESLNVKIIRNCTTIISDSRFDELSDIVAASIKMWDDVGYLFNDQLLIRTCSFENKDDFYLPNKTMPITSPLDTAKRVVESLNSLNNPDQILLHPRLSTEELKKRMSAVRFRSAAGSLIADIGIGGIDHVDDIERAHSVYNAKIDESFVVTHINGLEQSEEYDMCKRVFLAGKLFVPFAEEVIVPAKDRYKSIVYEFRILEKDGIVYMDFQDFEIE